MVQKKTGDIMVLYTEKQLEEAWHCHCAEIAYMNQESERINLPFPTLEDFRPMYEETIEDIHNGNI
jgi:hypothetical protein